MLLFFCFFFLQEGAVGGYPKPGYLGNSSKTEIQLSGAKISLKAHVAGMKTFEKRANAMCCKFVLKNIKTHLNPPFSFGMNNRTSSAKLRCQVFADLELAYHVTLFE